MCRKNLQLKNKIKDLQSGMSGNDILRIAAPSLMKLSDVTTQKILNSTPYSFQIPTYNYPNSNSLLSTPKYAPAKTTDATDLADTIANNNGVPVDGEANGATGDYPPPYGVQSSSNKSILLYGGLAAVLGFTAYYMFIKKK